MRINGPMLFISLLLVLTWMPGPLAGTSGSAQAQERSSAIRSSRERGSRERDVQAPALRIRPGQDDPERAARELLLGAKDALSSGNIAFLRPHLGQKVYLNLFTGINGYYSAGQAFLILEALFSTYQPISFSFSSRNFSIRNPYGFGPLTLERRGKRETAELFLSLASVNNIWVISQVTIATR